MNAIPISITSRLRNFLRYTLAPLLLLLCTPSLAVLMWEINTAYEGSLALFAGQIRAVGFFTELAATWAPVIWGTPTGWAIVGVFALTQLALMRWVPGRTFYGPPTPQGYAPDYRANGVPCFLITLALFVLGAYVFRWFSPTIIYDNFPGIIGALNVFSLAFCLLLYCKGRFFPSAAGSQLSGNFIFDYYEGTELYPRILGWDVKMFTNCRFALMSWALIILSFAAKQAELYGLSDGMVVALIIMLTYLVKFFVWETGYLCSIDIMHDRAGFMICWGCLVWVPAIYTSPVLYLVHHPHHLGLGWAALIAVLGVAAVLVNYLADRQRQTVRATGGQCRIWGRKPRIITARYHDADGAERESLLLASGWWGLARHFHYAPEILAAFLWSAPALFSSFLPYFYVTFLTILLVHRSGRDEERCRQKYGVYWDEYRQAVPSRIIPGLRF